MRTLATIGTITAIRAMFPMRTTRIEVLSLRCVTGPVRERSREIERVSTAGLPLNTLICKDEHRDESSGWRIPRTACAFSHGLPACGPCVDVLDRFRAGAQRGRDAGDAH